MHTVNFVLPPSPRLKMLKILEHKWVSDADRIFWGVTTKERMKDRRKAEKKSRYARRLTDTKEPSWLLVAKSMQPICQICVQDHLHVLYALCLWGVKGKWWKKERYLDTDRQTDREANGRTDRQTDRASETKKWMGRQSARANRWGK